MNKYMQEAIELSEENLITNNGGPFGACVVKDGVIIGYGSNNVLKNNDPTAHAEIMAIRDACKNIKSYDLSGCELYTSCYPCPMCLSAIIWANIKKVYYSANYLDAEEIGFRDKHIYDFIKNNYKGELIEFIKLNKSSIIEIYEEFKKEGEMY